MNLHFLLGNYDIYQALNLFESMGLLKIKGVTEAAIHRVGFGEMCTITILEFFFLSNFV